MAACPETATRDGAGWTLITRARIRGYKSLRDVEIDLQPLTLIIGPNASGKSNLLDALSLLARMCTKKTVKEAFEDHRGIPFESFYFGDVGLKGVMERPSAQFMIEVDVKLPPDVIDRVRTEIRQLREGLPTRKGGGEGRKIEFEPNLRYSLTVEGLTASGHLRIVDERLEALTQDGKPSQSRVPFIRREGPRLVLRMEGQGHPAYHDIGLDHTLVSTPLYPPHYPHINAFREEVSRWRFYYLEPKSMRAESPLKQVDTLGPYGADLAAFYNTLKAEHPRQFSSLSKSLKMILPTIDRFDVERTAEGFVHLLLEESGVPFSSRVISEGTLRILGLLAIASPVSPLSVVGYEEPENGVNPRRLSVIAQILHQFVRTRKTQVIATSHSPVLPEYFEERSLVVCRKVERATVFEPFKTTLGPLTARHDIERAIDSEDSPTPLFHRILRGDFGG